MDLIEQFTDHDLTCIPNRKQLHLDRTPPAVLRVPVKQAMLPAWLEETTIATMKPGRDAYVVPWAMHADKDKRLWLHPGFSTHVRPVGTATMLVQLRDDGYHVWLDAKHRYAPGESGSAQDIPVAVMHRTGEFE